MLADIDKIIVEFVEPALPGRFRKEGKIQEFTDVHLIAGPLARAGFERGRSIAPFKIVVLYGSY